MRSKLIRFDTPEGKAVVFQLENIIGYTEEEQDRTTILLSSGTGVLVEGSIGQVLERSLNAKHLITAPQSFVKWTKETLEELDISRYGRLGKAIGIH